MNTVTVTVTQDPEKFLWEVIPQPEKVGLIKIQLLNDAPFPPWYENHPSIRKLGEEVITLQCITSTGLKTRVWMGRETFKEYFPHLS